MASKYKRHARGGRFKSPNIGDLGISALRERDQTIIDSLQLARNQQAEIDQSQMTAIERSFDKERQNIQDLQSLEDKIYRNKREAIQVRNQRDIEALKGRADEYRRSAEYWEQLSPKLGQALTVLGKGYDNVTHKLGYRNALANQADNDTLKLWADKFDQGIQKADEQNLKDQEDLKKQGATETQLLGLDSTSAFYKAGRVTYLTQDIIDNLDEHLDQGMKAYIDQFGTVPNTTEEQSRAYNWILGQIEEGVGISTYKYHKGVIKLREEFNKKTADRVNGQTRARVASIFNQKYSERIHTFNASLKQTDPKDYFGEANQEKFDTLVKWTLERGMTKEGKRKYNTTAEAAKAIFETWAKDLSIPPEELFRRLDFKTPKDGRQPGDKATYAGRFPLLKEEIIEARSQAMKAKNLQYTTAEKYLGNKELLNVRAGIASGEYSIEDPEAANAKLKELELLPHGKEAAKMLRKVLHQNNVTADSVKTTFYSMINNSDFVEARSFLEHQGTLTKEDKDKLFSQIVPLNQLEDAGLSWDTHVVKELKKSLGKELDDGVTTSSELAVISEAKLPKAKNQFMTIFMHERSTLEADPKLNETQKTREASRVALKQVREDIVLGGEGKGEYAVVKKRDQLNTLGRPAYKSELIGKDTRHQVDFDPYQITNKNWDWGTELFKPNKRFVPDVQMEKWTLEVNSGFVSNTDLVEHIARELPPSMEAYHGKPRAIIKHLMKNGANATEESKLAADQITFDTKEWSVNLISADNPKLKKAVINSHSNIETLLLLLTGLNSSRGVSNYDPNRKSNKKERSY